MIERMVEGYRRADPPLVPQLAIHISVPNLCYTQASASKDPHQQATGHLILIAYYYLLRVGEYTQPKYIMRNGKHQTATRTVQFTVGKPLRLGNLISSRRQNQKQMENGRKPTMSLVTLWVHPQ